MEILLPTSVLVVPRNPPARRRERQVVQAFAVGLAVFELLAPSLGPHEHTFVEDTTASAAILALCHVLLGFIGVSRRLPLATALYVSFIMFMLGYALFEWWLPYFLGIVSEERVVRLDHVTRDAWRVSFGSQRCC